MRVCGFFLKIIYLLLLVTAYAEASPGPITVNVCAANYAGDCCGVFADKIQVKFCPGNNGADDFYVYQLKNLLLCDMAYCAVKYSPIDASTGLKCCFYCSENLKRHLKLC